MNRLAVLALAASVLTASASAAQDALNLRVTIDYRDAAAADVLGALARAAGIPLEIGPGALRPVTIALTNVKLGTALNAVCENASCAWRLEEALKIVPVSTDRLVALPPRVSLDLHDTPAADVFRALGAAIGVPVAVDLDHAREPTSLSLKFKDAATTDVLSLLCKLQRCEWSFDATKGLRVSQKP
jgi:hypothetical protein